MNQLKRRQKMWAMEHCRSIFGIDKPNEADIQRALIVVVGAYDRLSKDAKDAIMQQMDELEDKVIAQGGVRN